MPVNRIARQVARIGLVIADTQVRLGLKLRDQGSREPRVQMRIQHPDLPRPRAPPLQARGKTVDGHDNRVSLPCRDLRIGLMIGAVQSRQPSLDFGCVHMPVRGHDGAVIKLHHQRRIVFAPVRINDQTAEIRTDARAVKGRSQRPA